ncbi:MAG: hypothetical protein COV07_00395 [Candidatus Vogelbacteria bacterium CG10_big_fil_rev_8_21_14_0_10_45_14]|uniref:DUF2339 domain-containing protein n=1 Tax=Candidatus Vogelbacteria bacterium CG10_big_fil_rev_8_21_14_0_10_45_14 TaxID=1975042 RepID=A0A2H0RKP6_9BACT|nr:MAG: hypothetical protein COV07_00395 [Candidatus Vogelbacteria bacterium CG10_big_fil_rev_8_21_14_0_10_45_14]
MDTEKELKEIKYLISLMENKVKRLEEEMHKGKAVATQSTPVIIVDDMDQNHAPEIVPSKPPVPPSLVVDESAHSVPLKQTPNKGNYLGDEFAFGGNLFALVGVISLVIGAIAFYFYAVAQGWINEAVRVLIVLLVGGGLMAVGEFLKEKYKRYSSILFGGGIVLLYLSVYMANVHYSLIDIITAYAILVIFTVIAGMLSMRRGENEAIVISMLGAYLTPFLLGQAETSATALGIYMTIINIFVVVAAYYQSSFRQVAVGSLLASVFYGLYLGSFVADDKLSTFIALVFVNWIIFTVSSFVVFVKPDVVPDRGDYIFMGATGLVALGFFVPLFELQSPDNGGYAIGVLGLLYAALAVFATWTRSQERRVAFVYAALFGLFWTTAIALVLDGATMILAWAVLGVLYLVGAMYLRFPELQSVAVSLLALSVLAFFDFAEGNTSGTRVLLNVETITGIILSLLIAFSYYVSRHVESVKDWQKNMPAILLISSQVLAMITLILQYDGAENSALIAGLGALTLVASGTVFYETKARVVGYVSLLIAACAVLVSVLNRTVGEAVLQNPTFLTGIFLVVISIICYFVISSISKDDASALAPNDSTTSTQTFSLNMQVKNERNFLLVYVNALILFVVSAEIIYYFNLRSRPIFNELYILYQNSNFDSTVATLLEKQISTLSNTLRLVLDGFWALYGGALLTVGFLYRVRPVRLAGVTLVALVIVKMFLIDIWSFEILYRFVAFTLLGIFLLLVAFWYNHNREKIKEIL